MRKVLIVLAIGLTLALGCKKDGGENACSKLADKMCKLAPESGDCKEMKAMAAKASADDIKECEAELKDFQ